MVASYFLTTVERVDRERAATTNAEELLVRFDDADARARARLFLGGVDKSGFVFRSIISLAERLGCPHREVSKLREHLGSVVTIMKLSTDWHDFKAKLDRLYPRFTEPTQLSFEYDDDQDETAN